VLAICLAFWSVMTAVSGFAQNFFHLILARVGVAAGEAGTTPAAHALIARIYPSGRRALVLALFSLGVPTGSMLGLMLGGWVNDLVGWRQAFFIVGLPGVAVAVLVRLCLPAAPAQTLEGAPRPPLMQAVKFLFNLRSFRYMAAASSLFAIGSYAMNVFAPAFLMRTHGLSAGEAGFSLGLVSGLGGFIGTFSGGALADWLGRRDPRWRQVIPAIGMAICVPTALGAWLAPNLIVSLPLLAAVYLLGLMYFAPTFAAAQSLAPDDMRATAAAILLFCLTLIGSSVGPYVIGWASDVLAPRFGALSLRYALCLLAITMASSAWCFLLAAQALPADLEKRRAACAPDVEEEGHVSLA
jgi:predicted MFS family arabinose efflux permease